jgi:DNA-binding XRE family transcriptional regulator
MRTNLKLLRVKHGLTQEERAVKIGVTRCTYAAIEIGKRNGREFFWDSLQKAFNLTDEEMGKMRKKDPKKD